MSRVMGNATPRIAEAARACSDMLSAAATAIAVPGEKSSRLLHRAYRSAGGADAAAMLSFYSDAIALREAAAREGDLRWWCAACMVLVDDPEPIVADIDWANWAPDPEVMVRTDHGQLLVVLAAAWSPSREKVLETLVRSRPTQAEAMLDAMIAAGVLLERDGQVTSGPKAPRPRVVE